MGNKVVKVVHLEPESISLSLNVSLQGPSRRSSCRWSTCPPLRCGCSGWFRLPAMQPSAGCTCPCCLQVGGRVALLFSTRALLSTPSGQVQHFKPSFYFYMLPGHLCLPNVAAEVRFKCFGVISLSATSGSHFIKFTKLLTGYHETDKLRYDWCGLFVNLSQLITAGSDVHCGCVDSEWNQTRWVSLHEPLTRTSVILDK